MADLWRQRAIAWRRISDKAGGELGIICRQAVSLDCAREAKPAIDEMRDWLHRRSYWLYGFHISKYSEQSE